MRQITKLLCTLCALVSIVVATPDGGDVPPLPGPGLSYGWFSYSYCNSPLLEINPEGGDVPLLPDPGLSYRGIPYGSMSGNVAEFFKRQATSSGRALNSQGYTSSGVDYSPIEQWL